MSGADKRGSRPVQRGVAKMATKKNARQFRTSAKFSTEVIRLTFVHFSGVSVWSLGGFSAAGSILGHGVLKGNGN